MKKLALTRVRLILWLLTISIIIGMGMVSCPVEPSASSGSGNVDREYIWKGEFESADADALKKPEENWAYYNVTDEKLYWYTGKNWSILAQADEDNCLAVFIGNGGTPAVVPVSVPRNQMVMPVKVEKEGSVHDFWHEKDESEAFDFIKTPIDKNIILYAAWADDIIKFWLVHEMYTDTQRLTKMFIDAGKGRTFKESDLDNFTYSNPVRTSDTLKVHFEVQHWHAVYNDSDISQNHKYATETGNGRGNRIIKDAYVISDIESNMDSMERRDLNNPQEKLNDVSEGRYIVLEFYSERGSKNAGFPRTPGAESGWNSHNGKMMQHRHVYEFEGSPEFTVYNKDGSAQTVSRVEKYDSKWNANEIVPGEIQILLNKLEAGFVDISTLVTGDARTRLDYRLYKPERGVGPLYIWLHGGDGNRISDGTGTGENSPFWGGNENIPEFLQNQGHLVTGTGQMVNKAHQEKYGGYFVLAPQSNNGHDPKQLKACIDKVLRENPGIDKTRVYVSGHSMGGIGTLNLLINYPNFFAAAMPAPGSGLTASAHTDDDFLKMANTPLWLFTIRGDNTTMDNLTIVTYNGIRNNNGTNVRMTYYPVNGYNNGLNKTPTPDSVSSSYGGSSNDPVDVPGGFGWCHSAYEPAMSDYETTDGPWNVGYTNKTGSSWSITEPVDRTHYQNFEWNYKNPKDQAGLTTFGWIFSWKRPNPNSDSTVNPSAGTTTTMKP